MKARLLIVTAITLGLALCVAWVAMARAGAEKIPALPEHLSIQPEQAVITASNLPYTTFVQVTIGDPGTLDPALDYETAGASILQQIYEPLVFFNREDVNELIPMLATDWSISPDGLIYTFHIRQGVRFHNGSVLTPEDVAYTFQRGLLQGGSFSPQWLLVEPFFGTGIYDVAELISPALVDDREALKLVDPLMLRQTCLTVTNAIVADNANWVVTMTLSQPWNPFLVTLAQPWGSIMDKEWTTQNGGWDGSCDTWQNYYAMTSDEINQTAIGTSPMGTGPFMLEAWTPEVEISLRRNPYYWRKTPMWEGGPDGLAALEQVLIKNIPDGHTRYSMLVDGYADLASLSFADYGQLDDLVLFHYVQPDGLTGTLVHPTGTLKLYSGALSPSATDAFFNYNIITGGPRNYVGSGSLDGNGIPVDFFGDIHVRKAFNYAFDWTTYISNTFNGEAIQRRGPIIAGLWGYTDTQPAYFYSPTLALQEISQAWEGEVITHGFAMTLTYNEGNITRQNVATILKHGIEALDPRFHINVVGLTWSDFLEDQRGGGMPMFISGWIEDIPHPHNWVEPYLVRVYASRQNLPPAMKTVYQTKINTCVVLIGSAAQACYEDIQKTTYLDATDIFLAQGRVRQYLRGEVRGYYSNLSLSGPYFYALSKGPLPTIETIMPDVDNTINVTSTLGATVTLALPADSIPHMLDIIGTPDTIASGEPDGFHLGSLVFDIQAYLNGVPLSTLTFSNPVTLTLHYNSQATGPLIEEELRLFWWNGDAWIDASCEPYTRDTANNILQVPICHLSKFAIGGLSSHEVYLPMIIR